MTTDQDLAFGANHDGFATPAITGQSEHSGMPPLLMQYWTAVLRWKWIILGIIVAAVAVGLLVTLLTPLRYTATTQIEISREQKNITKVEGLESADAGQDLEFYDTQYALLQATSQAQRVSRRLGLWRSDAFFEAHGKSLNEARFGRSGGSLTREQTERRQRAATELLLDNVSVSPVRKSRIVAVGYTSRSPEMSARIANTWAQEFIAATMARQFASTADARAFLETRLGQLRGKVEQSERDLVNYASTKNIVALNDVRDAEGRTQTQRTLAAADVEALNTALAAAITDRIAAESRAKLTSAAESPEALASPTVAQLRGKRAEVAADYAKMLAQFEPGYPAAKALSDQIKVLDSAIARETARFSGSRGQSYQEALKRENSLRTQLEAYKGRFDTQQRDTIQYNVYQREADTNRQLYEALLGRYKEIGVAGAVGPNNIVIVDAAEVPDSPSAPSLPKNLAIALLGGLMLAAIVTLALEQIDEGVRDPSQVSRLLNLPLLGYVPDSGADMLVELEDAKSHAHESYLSVRSNLAFTTSHGLPRTFMVTSTRSGEGKSTSSFALAMIIGRTGKRVLLIDADMRSPSVHKYVGGENEGGLSNLLAGEENWQPLVRQTRLRDVSVLTAGPTPPSAAELLSNERIRTLIAQLREHFDYIVVDAPPVLALSDAPLLSRAVEGCVYVVEAEGAAIRAIRASIDRLDALGAQVFGVILTKVKQRNSSYGYGYGYGNGYGYGRDEARGDGAA